MTVHDPRNIPNTSTAPIIIPTHDPSSPVSAEECQRHITALMTLAGKHDDSCTTPESLQAFLLQNPDIVKMSIELLTSTADHPAGRGFDQLFPQAGIDAYLDADNHPLPGAEPHICGVSAHMVEIPHDDVCCNSAARHDYVQKMLIPEAARRVTTALQEVMTPAELQKLLPGDIAQLGELSKRLTELQPNIAVPPHNPNQPFNGSPCFAGSMPEGPINHPYATD